MTLTVIAAFEAKAGREDDLRTALEAMIEPSVAEPGCIGYEPYVDPNRPERMVIVEEWDDRAALDFHFTTPHFKHVVGVLDELLAAPFRIRFLTDTEESA
ncbi:putative quinol monooxygenase [Yinghuangia seranimata]|uniref:putative quinol monooxygenase n=1 Tax=Yinghuangia seranimata TaxID=408067 RepID=UPI00248AACDA|nr:putative quinol monooxygenase [Yinghuangia seranimata]MDI2128251.1 putative quinol monooxygenase [Yinghuangia seranimata]